MRLGGGKINRAVKALTAALALTFALHSPVLRADDEMGAVCGGVLNAPNLPPGDPKAAALKEKQQYCQAAKDAEDSADANSAMWKVWAAVGVVCTYACVASFVGGPTSEYLCMGVTAAGGVTDAIVTKNFTSAIMAIGGVGMGYAANQAINKSSESAKEAGKEGAEKSKKDVGACLNAAMAIFQAFMKHKSMNDSEKSMHDNLASAKAVRGAPGTATDPNYAGFQPGQDSGQDGTGGNSGGLGNGGGGTGLTQSNGPGGKQSCVGQTSGNGTASTIMQCAVASDQTLPPFVTDPKFPQEFQKRSGKSLGDFLTSSASPGALMSGASSNGFTPSQSSKLAAAIDDIGQYAGSLPSTGGGMYAGGGGGSSGGAEEDPMAQMGSMMQGLMDQMNPNKKKDAPGTGVSAVIFANQTRSPAAVAEDRKLSIFDRVTYRYYYVGRRIVLGEGDK